MQKKSLAPWPCFDKGEIDTVTKVLRSGKVNYWTGKEGKEFEKEFASLFNTQYAIALSNGTVALELALHAVGLAPGDEVIVTPRTFLASASCVVIQGGIPVFADVDPISGNITASTIKKVITNKTKAIIPVHLAGWPCEMDEIMDLAHKHDLYVIEDCAQAHGATYKGRPIGSIGHMGAFSFCQDKIMTTGGEGGMLITNDKALWEKSWAYKDHGKNYDTVYNKKHPPGFRWLHDTFGTNFRLTEMQSAIGRYQLKKLPEWTRKRQDNSTILDSCIKKIPALQLLEPPSYIGHARYKYYTNVRQEYLKSDWNRGRIQEAIFDEGIPCFVGICSEIYNESAFDDKAFKPTQPLPISKELGEKTLMFLVHPTLTNEDMKTITKTIEKIFNLAMK